MTAARSEFIGVDALPVPAGPLYLYALTRTSGPSLPPVPALDGVSPVVLLPSGDIAAVVSTAPVGELASISPEDLSETGRLGVLARRHDAVVRAAFERSAVLPFRFGTVLEGPAVVLALLRDRHLDARSQLDRTEGHREWGVRMRITAVNPGSPAVSPRSTSAASEQPRPSGAAYLMRRRDELAAARTRDQFVRHAASVTYEALSRQATDGVSRSASASPDVVLDAAYLVALAAEADFITAFRRLAEEQTAHDLQLELTGPWPPYTFGVLQTGSAPR